MTGFAGDERGRALNPVTQGWLRTLAKLEDGEFDEAYQEALELGDDLYLLRLIAQTGPVVKKLNQRTLRRVLRKLNKIVRGNVL